MVLHKDAEKYEKWDRLKETNPVLRSWTNFRRSYDDSENPVVSSVRSVTQTIGSWFDENETAQVTRILRTMDPTFQMENFSRELREYIVPEVVDAYLSADRESLQMWCSEAVSWDPLLALHCWLTSILKDLQRAMGNDGAVPEAGSDKRL